MSILSELNLSVALNQTDYVEQLTRYQLALSQLGVQVFKQKRPVVIVFEGWDAAGKGGCIKRLVEYLDPRGYAVYSTGAPIGDERTHHYMYRFWRHVPERGRVAIFDRSWYGRVLIDRVEGFVTEAEWRRAYREINQFERELIDFGASVFKFWLQIDQAEQLRRFEERGATPQKAWKVTPEDWRNREKWECYEEAVDEMLLKTGTAGTPWTVVEANDKWWARVKVLRIVAEGLATDLKVTPDAMLADSGKGGKRGKRKRADML